METWLARARAHTHKGRTKRVRARVWSGGCTGLHHGGLVVPGVERLQLEVVREIGPLCGRERAVQLNGEPAANVAATRPRARLRGHTTEGHLSELSNTTFSRLQ